MLSIELKHWLYIHLLSCIVCFKTWGLKWYKLSKTSQAMSSMLFFLSLCKLHTFIHCHCHFSHFFFFLMHWDSDFGKSVIFAVIPVVSELQSDILQTYKRQSLSQRLYSLKDKNKEKSSAWESSNGSKYKVLFGFFLTFILSFFLLFFLFSLFLYPFLSLFSLFSSQYYGIARTSLATRSGRGIYHA